MVAHNLTHRPESYRDYHIFDSLVLRIDIELELARARTYFPLLRGHAVTFKKAPYPSILDSRLPGRCFDLARELAEKHELLYCEGLVVFNHPDGLVPYGHGWNCTPDGTIIDSVLAPYQDHLRVAYIGFPIKLPYVDAWKRKVGNYGCLDGYSDGTMGEIYTDKPTLWKEALRGS